ncbi:MAG: proton-conducting transporter membrane subunit [Planctomycetaceae bacterium]
MNELHFPWLESSILFPLIGAVLCQYAHPRLGPRIGIGTALLTLLTTLGAWRDFLTLHEFAAHDHWYFAKNLLGERVLVIDELSAPLLSLSALTYFVTLIATAKTKARRFSYSGTLYSLSILMATLSTGESWLLVGLLALGTLPVFFELRMRGKSTRIFTIHMGLFLTLLTVGWGLWNWQGPSLTAAALLTVAVLIRCGIAPLHCWLTDLFENASFGTALLFCTPMVGIYAAMHFVFPIAPTWALRLIAIASMITALYAAAMTLVQVDARRFFCYLFLSHSSLVLVGLEVTTPQGLAGALSLWLAVGLSLTGFGVVLRSVEARVGAIRLDRYHGLYDHVPTFGVFFLITGMASVGFPGTFGFFASELLIDATVDVYPSIGLIVVLATALNGIAVLQAYLRVFTGTRRETSVSIGSRPAERVAILLMTALIVGGGLFPQPGIESRFHASEHLFQLRIDPGRVAEPTPQPITQPPSTVHDHSK